MAITIKIKTLVKKLCTHPTSQEVSLHILILMTMFSPYAINEEAGNNYFHMVSK